MKLRIILFSFISLSLIASQPAQTGQPVGVSTSTSSNREALIAAALKLKRPVTLIPPAPLAQLTLGEFKEWCKAHCGEYNYSRYLDSYDYALALQIGYEESRTKAYDAAIQRYKVELAQLLLDQLLNTKFVNKETQTETTSI
ncbi:MAG TPA: hypothetical protein VLG50_00550 [Candidatus Saccharimonadales bacterium]|nr:hypothetical protein [Candidatus Saccharimonadales bacterium]